MKTRALLAVVVIAAASVGANEFVCLADALNVRAAPSSAAGVLTVIKSGDVVRGLSDCEEDWERVITPAGVEGWVSAQYLLATKDYDLIKPAIDAARRDDAAACRDALAPLVTEGKVTVYPSPDGGAALVSIEYGRNVVLVAGKGAVARVPAFADITIKAEWSADGRYVACDDGTDVFRGLACFGVNEEKVLLRDGVWGEDFRFARSRPVLFWVRGKYIQEEELEQTERRALAAFLRDIGQYGGVTFSEVMAFDCGNGETYVVLEPDEAGIKQTESEPGRFHIWAPMRTKNGTPPALIQLFEKEGIPGPFYVVTDWATGGA